MSERLPIIDDDWTVFAFTDVHAVVTGLLAALREAGIVDDDGRWIAPPRTALVGCGDYIDRGADAVGMIRLLRRLEAEAAEAGGRAFFARGNHEVIALRAAAGEARYHDMWLEFGGVQTLRSFGCVSDCAEDPGAIARAMESVEPGVIDWLHGLPQAVRWRDVLFSHGGLAPDHALADLGVTTEEHLWIRAGFFATAWGSGVFDRYIEAGIERVVFGHTPQPYGTAVFHEGHSICIDTNAVGNSRLPADAQRVLTLIEVSSAPRLADARLIRIDTSAAPDRRKAPSPAAHAGH